MNGDDRCPHCGSHYRGWLVSPDIVKRSLAVIGHSTLGTLLLYIPIALLLICAGAMSGLQ